MLNNVKQFDREPMTGFLGLRMPQTLRGDLHRVALADGRSDSAFALRAIATGIAAFDQRTTLAAVPPVQSLPSWETCA